GGRSSVVFRRWCVVCGRSSVVGGRSSVVGRQSSVIVAALLLMVGGPGGEAGESHTEPLWARWQQSIGRLHTLAVSPKGNRLLSLDWRNQLTCFDSAGKTVWS